MASILVVDDYGDTAEFMALWLKQFGHDVQIAGDGYRAIEIAHRQGPTYVLLDLGLPGLDGYQVAARLRQEVAGPQVIIAVSGFTQDECRRRALAAGCDQYFLKPIDPGALVALLSASNAGPDSPNHHGPQPEVIRHNGRSTRADRRHVEITNTLGLHLRAADKFVRLLWQFRADVRIAFGDRTASGLSVLDLTSLAAARGSRLELAADGPDAEEALDALTGLIGRCFDEQE